MGLLDKAKKVVKKAVTYANPLYIANKATSIGIGVLGDALGGKKTKQSVIPDSRDTRITSAIPESNSKKYIIFGVVAFVLIFIIILFKRRG